MYVTHVTQYGDVWRELWELVITDNYGIVCLLITKASVS